MTQNNVCRCHENRKQRKYGKLEYIFIYGRGRRKFNRDFGKLQKKGGYCQKFNVCSYPSEPNPWPSVQIPYWGEDFYGKESNMGHGEKR